MSDEMRMIIEECYQYFSKFHTPSMLNLCDCGMCISKEDINYLLNQPLREISAFKMYCYMDAVRYPESIDRSEMPYFLPRALELIAQYDRISMCVELDLAKLKQIDPCILDKKAHQLLNDFALQYWKDWLQSISEQTHKVNYELSEILIMFSYANLSIEPLLNHLNGLINFEVVSKIAELIFSEREASVLTNAFANYCININSEINQWLKNNAKALSQNAQIAVLNMPDLAWHNKTKIDYLRGEYLLAMCDENVILATLPDNI